ncbi:MAG: TetR/AcrR family transcriptional regulator [Deltaproteobacteria bacterium]|nr:TetR/AcrR family transcriptional regulator [Deltaproteobacteria bacterium]
MPKENQKKQNVVAPPPNSGAMHSREKILNAAARLFMRKGFKGTSLNDIAREARLNKVTIYYHFKNKMTLIYEIAVSNIHGIMALDEHILDADISADEKLNALIYNHIKWVISHPGRLGFNPLLKINLTPKLYTEYVKAREAYLSLFLRVIEQGQANGEFQKAASCYDPLFIVQYLNALVQRLDSRRQSESIENIVISAHKLISNIFKV